MNKAQNKTKTQIELMAHGLKTPISCTLMFVQNLCDTQELTQESRNYLKMIDCQLKLMMNMIADFQDINLIKAGRLEVKISLFSPKKVFEFVKDMFIMQA